MNDKVMPMATAAASTPSKETQADTQTARVKKGLEPAATPAAKSEQ